VYKTVVIGTQTWMAENLNYDAGSGSYCYGDNNTCDTYGRFLYDWATAMNGASSSDASPSGVQGVCPSGWHLPSDTEWETMASFVASDAGLTAKSGDDWTEIGTVLKANSSLWDINTGTDAYGFAGLPGGYRFTAGSYPNVGHYGYWWSSTEYSSIDAYNRSLFSNDAFFYRSSHGKNHGYSIRCLKN